MKNKHTELQKKLIDFIKNKFITVYIGLLILLSLALFQPLSMQFVFIVFIISILFFLFGKDIVKENTKNKSIKLFKLSLYIASFSLITIVSRRMNAVITSGKSILPFTLMLYLGASVLITHVLLSGDTKERIDKIIEKEFITESGLLSQEDIMKEGDLKICVNKQTGKPVILPHKDRYVHTLVLGPTGSGKTSQSLLPSILQDMKNSNCGFTVLEPKGDLAEQVYGMGKILGREVIYFNPTYPDCPYFNPLYGPEAEVVENIVTVFQSLAETENQFFADKNEILTRNGIMLIKRLYGNDATLLDFSNLIHDTNGQGYAMVKEFQTIKAKTVELDKQNQEIAAWFLEEYFNERSKEFEHFSGLRSQVAKTVSNEHLRRVLNPPKGRNDIDFDKVLEEGKVLAISTAQGELRDMSRYLGYFIILNYQSAVFRRPGTEDTRRPHFLYIDEFQTYSNPAFSDMLTQGRSYRVGCVLATQARDQMAIGKGREGEIFLHTVSSNARNVILFPGLPYADVKYYSDEFGTIKETVLSKSHSQEAFSLFNSGRAPTESVSEREEEIPRYSPTELRYKKFMEITYSIVQNNSLQPAGDGLVDFIPYDMHLKIGEIATSYRNRQLAKAAKLKKEENENTPDPNKPVEDIVSVKDPLAELMEEDNKEVIEDFEYGGDFVRGPSDPVDDVI